MVEVGLQVAILLFAAVFGYFYLKSINILYYKHIKNPNINGVLFITFFILILPITNINGFNKETLDDVLYSNTGYRNWEQYEEAEL